MTRRVRFLLFILVAASAAVWAAANPVVGKWSCIATDTLGQQTSWTLVVKQDGDKLSGTLSGDQGEFQLVDLKVAGKAFTFKVLVGDATYTVDSKVDGKTITGKYSGPEASGTIKATRQP